MAEGLVAYGVIYSLTCDLLAEKTIMELNYIKNIGIKGFKSIKELEPFPMEKTNVLIGANGAGKSNFIEALKLIQAIVNGKLQEYFHQYGDPDGFFFNGRGETQKIVFGVEFTKGYYECCLGLDAKGNIRLDDEKFSHPVINPELLVSPPAAVSMDVRESTLAMNASYDNKLSSVDKDVKESINSWKHYHFHNTEPTSPLRRAWDVKDNLELHSDGSNLAPFIMNLRNEHPDHYQALCMIIQYAVPCFKDFILIPKKYGNGENKVDLSWQNKHSNSIMPPYHLSDGSLRLIALIISLLQPNPPSAIIIDEPELGLHPDAISVFVEAAKNETQESQVILATNSPLILNECVPEDIITVNCKEEGSKFERVEESNINEWLKEEQLGDLWLSNVIAASP